MVTSYTFDAISRLATLVQNPASTSHDTTFTFGYNPSSQITSRTRSNGVYDWLVPASSSESYAADGLNRYTSALGVAPTYDTRGNLTYDGIKTYTYDVDNRLLTASGGVTLNYDPFGRLHQVAGGTTTRFLYDGADMIAEYNTGGTVLRRFVHGPGLDEPLVWYEGSGTSDRRYLIADERGSVIGVTNNTGTVTQVNKYDGFGVPNAANQGRFQYTGQMWIAELGLYHYKARAYHPKLGRFMQTDSIGYAGGMNLYGYVGNDPTNGRDPFGLTEELDGYCNQMSAMCTPVPPGALTQIFPYYCDWLCQLLNQEQARIQSLSDLVGQQAGPVSGPVPSEPDPTPQGEQGEDSFKLCSKSENPRVFTLAWTLDVQPPLLPGFGGGTGIGFTGNGQLFIQFIAQGELGEWLNLSTGLQGSIGRNIGDMPVFQPVSESFIGGQAAFGLLSVFSGGWTRGSSGNTFSTDVGRFGGGIAGQLALVAGTETRIALSPPLCR